MSTCTNSVLLQLTQLVEHSSNMMGKSNFIVFSQRSLSAPVQTTFFIAKRHFFEETAIILVVSRNYIFFCIPGFAGLEHTGVD